MIYKNNEELPKNRRRKAQFEKILDMAINIVINQGSEYLTMQNLANKLDFTAGALYRYYSSKDEIISDIQRRCIEEFSNLFDEVNNNVALILNQNELKPILLIILVSELLGKYSLESPVKFSFLTNLMSDPKVLVNEVESAKVFNSFKILFFKLIAIFSEAINNKQLHSNNVLELVLVYISSLQGILQLKKLSRIDSNFFNVESLRKNATKSLLIGWGLSEENFNKAEKYLSDNKFISITNT